MGSNKRRPVPRTDEALDQLVEEVVVETDYADKQLTAALVCQAIINLPKDEDHVAVSHLAAIVRKELSRALCKDRLTTINKDLTEQNKLILEKNLIIQFNMDPNDMEVRDKLQVLAERGSEKAKAALGDAFTPPAPPKTEAAT